MAVYFNGTQVSEMYFGGTIGWGGTGTLQSQTFTTSGTFTVPANVRQIYVICTGGGGGACYYSGESGFAAGGGGSGSTQGFFHVTPGAVYTVTIGAGGLGKAEASGTSGGTTSFGALLTCTGASGAYSSSYKSFSNNGVLYFTAGTGLSYFYRNEITNIHAAFSSSGGGFSNSGNGGPGGFGSGGTGVGAANSGAGGGIYVNTPYNGGSGRCVVYWFTYA